jgi:large subunit ribosomal protein L18
LFVQVIDDLKGATLASASTSELGEKAKLNIENSKSVGKKIAEKALASGVNTIVFDRNGYLYHGNIKALAEGAREGGLKF